MSTRLASRRATAAGDRPSTAAAHRWLSPLVESTCYYRVYGTLPGGTAVSECNSNVRLGPTPPLDVSAFDLLIQQNAVRHFTNKYEVTMPHNDEISTQAMDAELLIRRGQEFSLEITFDREFTTGIDGLRLGFEIGTKPMISKGTAVVVEASSTDAPKGQWSAKIAKVTGNKVALSVCSPATAQVGKWDVYVETTAPGAKQVTESVISRYLPAKTVTVIFNPWCKDDDVFMADEDERAEYVLNETGKVYTGNENQISYVPWTFGQFDDVVIKCVLWLLDNKSRLDVQQRGDVVRLVRDISAFVNSNDERGLMEGRWDGSYQDGTSPTKWINSTAILRQYLETKKPVKYGQCWVFSAVTTTICRCLGIPVRSVTNFSSAHDTDGSMSIDMHFTAAGVPLEDENVDSIWNFHVWNEVWMARRDLPSGYGGWQAIDATPQETSGGIFCVGPASVTAIKQGLVTLPYDTGFVFAEVNADRINWVRDESGSYKKFVEPNVIGWNISTKSCPKKTRYEWGRDDREDVTHAYKYPEGSWEERAAVKQAMASSTKPEAYEKSADDLTFTSDDKVLVPLGGPFDVPIKVKNNSASRRSVSIAMTCSSVYYTGVPHKVIKFTRHTGSLAAGEEKTFSMSVTWKDYAGLLVDQYDVRVQTLASVTETKQVYLYHDNFRLSLPALKVQVPETVQAGGPFAVKVSFTNPLPTALTNCIYTVDGSGLLRPAELPVSGVGPSKESVVSVNVQSKATAQGSTTVMVSFQSTELCGAKGEAQLTVRQTASAPQPSAAGATAPPVCTVEAPLAAQPVVAPLISAPPGGIRGSAAAAAAGSDSSAFVDRAGETTAVTAADAAASAGAASSGGGRSRRRRRR